VHKNTLLVLFLLLLPLLSHSIPLDAQALPAAQELPFSFSAPSVDCEQRTAEDFVPMTRSERIAYAVNRAVNRVRGDGYFMPVRAACSLAMTTGRVPFHCQRWEEPREQRFFHEHGSRPAPGQSMPPSFRSASRWPRAPLST
jgi:hypothetical protein